MQTSAGGIIERFSRTALLAIVSCVTSRYQSSVNGLAMVRSNLSHPILILFSSYSHPILILFSSYSHLITQNYQPLTTSSRSLILHEQSPRHHRSRRRSQTSQYNPHQQLPTILLGPRRRQPSRPSRSSPTPPLLQHRLLFRLARNDDLRRHLPELHPSAYRSSPRSSRHEHRRCNHFARFHLHFRCGVFDWFHASTGSLSR